MAAGRAIGCVFGASVSVWLRARGGAEGGLGSRCMWAGRAQAPLGSPDRFLSPCGSRVVMCRMRAHEAFESLTCFLELRGE